MICKKYFLKFFVLLTVMTVLLSSWGCDAILENVIGWMEENIRYEYDITVSFSDESDAELFEARLEALEISVTESDGDGKYLLDSHYTLKDGFFEAMCSDGEIFVTNELGSEIILQKDVTEARFDGVILEITIGTELYDSISADLEESLYLARGEHRYAVLAATEESENGVTVSFCEPESEIADESEHLSGYEKSAIMLVSVKASEPLKGDISVIIDETRVSDGEN